MRLYCIYDSLGELCDAPFIAKNDDVAKRNIKFSFTECPESMKDFQLLYIGDFDESCGVITPQDNPVVVSDLFSILDRGEKLDG